MSKNSPIILAINSGTREVGIAVIASKELIFYGIKTIRNQKTPTGLLNKVSTVITHLIINYQPTHLAIKKVIVIQKSSTMNARVAEQIKMIASKNGLKVCEYAPYTLRQPLCKTARATKQELARNLTTRYPELGKYAVWKNHADALYWGRLFDAIAAGLYLQDLIS